MKKAKANSHLSSQSLQDSMNNKVQTLNNDWLSAHRDIEKPKLLETPEVQAFMQNIWPAGDSYFSPIQTAFMVQFINLGFFNRQPAWIIRDGLIPLLWFFKTHPRPTGVKSRLYIHENLTEFVPKEWQELVGTYKIISASPFENTAEPNKILIAGIVSETYSSIKSLPENLKIWSQKRPSVKLTDLPKFAFLPFKTWGADHWTQMSFHPNYMVHLCKAMGTDIQVLNWHQMQSTDSWEGTYVLDLNDGMVCADSYFNHMALARGARLWLPTEANPSADYISLSPYHGFEINESPDFSESISFEVKRSLKETSTFANVYLKAVRSETNQVLPWPKWFSSWAQDLGSHKP